MDSLDIVQLLAGICTIIVTIDYLLTKETQNNQ